MVAFQLAIQILLTMLVGVVAKRTKLIDDRGVQGFAAVLLNAGIPCLIVHSLNMEFDAAQFRAGLTMVLLSFLLLVLLFFAGLVYRRLARDPVRGGIGQFCIMFPNFTFVGNPVMESLFGANGVFLLTMMTAPVRIFFYSLPAFLMDPGGHKSAKEVLRVFVSPPLVALYVGLLIYLCRIPVPAPVSKTLSAMAAFTSAGGLLLCGMRIADVNPRALLRRPKLLILPLLRNLGAPLLALALMLALPFDPTSESVAVMYAALPFPATAAIFAMKYAKDPEAQQEVAVSTMLSTVLCVGTLPLMYWLVTLTLGG